MGAYLEPRTTFENNVCSTYVIISEGIMSLEAKKLLLVLDTPDNLIKHVQQISPKLLNISQKSVESSPH